MKDGGGRFKKKKNQINKQKTAIYRFVRAAVTYSVWLRDRHRGGRDHCGNVTETPAGRTHTGSVGRSVVPRRSRKTHPAAVRRRRDYFYAAHTGTPIAPGTSVAAADDDDEPKNACRVRGKTTTWTKNRRRFCTEISWNRKNVPRRYAPVRCRRRHGVRGAWAGHGPPLNRLRGPPARPIFASGTHAKKKRVFSKFLITPTLTYSLTYLFTYLLTYSITRLADCRSFNFHLSTLWIVIVPSYNCDERRNCRFRFIVTSSGMGYRHDSGIGFFPLPNFQVSSLAALIQ